MSLFVRLDAGYWVHRKTLRLRSLLGDAALWIPPRLWCYAAQNQPDGDFSHYLPTELGMLLGCSIDGQAMLEALQQAGFMDGLKIHGWEEHNAYHHVFSERAKKAAAARWGKKKKGKQKTREEKRGEEQASSSNACVMLQAFDEFWQAYPRKAGKAHAEKAWKNLGCEKLLPQILTTVRKCKISSDWTRDGGQFIPHPATWLNRRGWDDELPTHYEGTNPNRNGATGRNVGHNADVSYDRRPAQTPNGTEGSPG